MRIDGGSAEGSLAEILEWLAQHPAGKGPQATGGGRLYVFAFGGNRIKCGRARRPLERLREHAATLSKYGVHEIERVWVSSWLPRYIEAEEVMLKELGAPTAGNEWFQGRRWEDVIAAARQGANASVANDSEGNQQRPGDTHSALFAVAALMYRLAVQRFERCANKEDRTRAYLEVSNKYRGLVDVSALAAAFGVPVQGKAFQELLLRRNPDALREDDVLMAYRLFGPDAAQQLAVVEGVTRTVGEIERDPDLRAWRGEESSVVRVVNMTSPQSG